MIKETMTEIFSDEFITKNANDLALNTIFLELKRLILLAH